MKINIILFFLLGTAYNLFAESIRPRPLRKLIIESEFIVYADVIGFESENLSEYDWHSRKAILVIKEILHGEIKSDTVKVLFSPDMVCPSPAEYYKGTSVLAFLDSREHGKYSTHALSYGAKTIEKPEYDTYKKRIQEYQNILKINNRREKDIRTIDWLITCAVNPVTRYEGIAELSETSDFMSYYDRNKDSYVKKHELNQTQKSILRKAFFSIDKLNYSDSGLFELIVKENDTELLNFVINKTKLIPKGETYLQIFFLEEIAELSNRDDLRKIIKEYYKLDYDNKKVKEKMISDFLEII